MSQSSEGESEILLGNKQLLAVFFVGVVLLGIAFTGGYMLGRGAAGKKPQQAETAAVNTASSPSASPESADTDGQVGETHSVPAYGGSVTPAEKPSRAAEPESSAKLKASENLLGARKKAGFKPTEEERSSAKASKADGFTPQSGQEFLQVAAVPRNHAEAVAAVLRRKGFHAHAVPKPGKADLYRVIVGPIRDPGELSSTRDSLRKTGFNQVIIQHFE